MNICMISGYKNFVGGLENVVNELENFLLKHDIGVTVYTESKLDYMPKKLQTLFYSRSNYHKIVYSFKTWRNAISTHFDIIHGHGDNCFGSFLLRDNTPFLMTFHGTYAVDCRGQIRNNDPRILPSLYAEKIAAARCDIAVACSKAVKEEIKSFYGIKNKIAVIYNGVDTKKFTPKDKDQARQKLNLPYSECYALWVGRDPIGKGLPAVLKTLTNFPEIHLIVVGYKMPNTKNITYLGKTSLDNLVDAYNASDFLFFPTLYEGFPLVPMEAMACGLPILVSKESNMGEVITQGKHGFVVENREYRDKVELLLQDQELRRKLGANCRKLSLQYSWVKQAEKYLELYERLLN